MKVMRSVLLFVLTAAPASAFVPSYARTTINTRAKPLSALGDGFAAWFNLKTSTFYAAKSLPPTVVLANAKYNAAVREFGANSQAAKAALREAKAAMASAQQAKAAAAAGNGKLAFVDSSQHASSTTQPLVAKAKASLHALQQHAISASTATSTWFMSGSGSSGSATATAAVAASSGGFKSLVGCTFATAAGALAPYCMLPAFLGLWRREYAVSYGYALAMALAGGRLLATGAGLHPLAKAQALVLVAYGVRLGVFLLQRELTLERFKVMAKRIDEKHAEKNGEASSAVSNFLARIPFIVSVGALYLGMSAPMVLTARYASAIAPQTAAAALATQILPSLMVVGFAVAALGDHQKSKHKAKWAALKAKGDPAATPAAELTTGGLYRVLRHPNYLGEQLLWTSNFALGLTCALAGPTSMGALVWLAWSALGAVGINAVLMKAATGLESRQEAKYGLTTEYRVWLQQAWGGFHTHTPTPLFDEANEMTEADRRRCAETGECPVE